MKRPGSSRGWASGYTSVRRYSEDTTATMASRASRGKVPPFIFPYLRTTGRQPLHNVMNSTSKPRLLRNLQIGFGLSLLILVVTSVASYSSIRNLLLGSRLVDHTDSVISELNMTLSTLKDAETGQRGYLLSNDTAFLRPYWGSRERALMLLDRVQRMTLDNPIQQQNCKELKDLIFNRLAIMQEVIEEKRKTGSYTATSLEKGREYMNEVRDVVQRMQDEEHQLLVIRTEKVESYASYAPVLIIAADLMAMLLTVFFYGRVHRDFLERHQLYSE